MRDLLLYLLKPLVDSPESIKVTISESDSSMVATIAVDKQDIGRVIGKEGKTINAVRSLAKIIAAKQKKRLDLTLLQ